MILDPRRRRRGQECLRWIWWQYGCSWD